MASPSSPLEQARQLFLAEVMERCQQIEEGVLLLAHAPTPYTLSKVDRQIQAILQGADQVELPDLQHLALGLATLLEHYTNQPERSDLVFDLLHPLCEGLRMACVAYHPLGEGTPTRELATVQMLIPKVLETLELILAQPFPVELQTQLFVQQTQWIHHWSNTLPLTELHTLTTATLTSLQTFPQAAAAVFPVALAAFQVASRTTLQDPPESKSIQPEPELTLERTSDLTAQEHNEPEAVLEVSGYLVGLTHQTVFCVATESIAEIVLPQPQQILREADQDWLLWQDHRLKLHRFNDLWEFSQPLTLSPGTTESSGLILVLTQGSEHLALALTVDRLIVASQLTLGQPDTITRPCPANCYGWTYIDGLWMEVIDVNRLLQSYLEGQAYLDKAGITPSELTFQTAMDWSVAWEDSTSQPDSAPDSAQDILAQEPPSDWPAAAVEPITLLVVDDSKTVRELLALTLRDAGYCVLQAADGQAAIAHLQTQPHIRLILCDIEMSNLNGFEFLRHRLQNTHWSHIPVL
ncbi:MAG TPA: response regulator, partial [Stenomitos sp.]